MGEFSLMHWLVVLVILLLVFGAKRLPEMGASLGKGLREFKRSVSGLGDPVDDDRPAVSRGQEPQDRATPRTENREPKRLSQ